MDWRTKRQLTIIACIMAVLVCCAGLVVVPRLVVTPTCTDGKQNGAELGVDCGGGCTRFCKAQTTDIVLKWTRAFPITDSVWSAVAYVSNPNVDASVAQISYEFKLYDADRKYIGERLGTTYVGANSASVIYESGIQVGSRVPAYTTFRFTTTPLFFRTDARTSELRLTTKDVVMSNLDTRPKVTGSIVNTSTRYSATGGEVAVVLYDQDNNAVGVSESQLDTLGPEGETPVIFTWPKAFTVPVVRYELVARINPFTQTFN